MFNVQFSMEIKQLLVQTKNLTILYVEDSKEIRESIFIVLQEVFKTIYIAHDGLDGLKKYAQHRDEIDIIISDIHMPHMNGLEMIKNIREIQTDIPIFIFSAYNSTDYFIEAINYNINGYLLKPFDLNQFLNTLKITIENLYLKRNLEHTIDTQLKIIRKKDLYLQHQAKFAALGEMIDAIAHQWKNPLSQISVDASSLLYFNESKLHTVTKEQIQEYAESILQQTQHMSETITEFRNFFRDKDTIEHLNIRLLIENTILLVQDQLKMNEISITINCKKDIFMDIIENEFKHVVINLLTNAKDAFIENNIKNRQINCTIKLNQENNIVNIHIEDNAGGIPKDIIDKIFLPNITTKGNQGTGIGLYLTKQILEKIHGSIKVLNNDKGGASFLIRLKQNL